MHQYCIRICSDDTLAAYTLHISNALCTCTFAIRGSTLSHLYDACLADAAEIPLPADLIQSAMYSGESAGADQDQPYSGRGRPEPAHVRGHQGLDIDSAAAHRIPRGIFSSLMPVQAFPAPFQYPSAHLLFLSAALFIPGPLPFPYVDAFPVALGLSLVLLKRREKSTSFSNPNRRSCCWACYPLKTDHERD